MQLTRRDVSLLRDMALSHVLSRDQVLELGYFATVTRVNTRLRELRSEGFVRRLETPFYRQSLYAVGRKSLPVLGDHVARLVSNRTPSPRFLQHALCVTNARIWLQKHGATKWKFEQQLFAAFRFSGKEFQVRPDGLAHLRGKPTAVEVDLGHVTPSKFADKLKGYAAFAVSHECRRFWACTEFALLTITTGQTRAAHLYKLAPKPCGFDFTCVAHEEIQVPFVGAWS